jgi:hypothetical protein
MVWTLVLDLKPSCFLVSDRCSNYRFYMIVARKHRWHQGRDEEMLYYFWLYTWRGNWLERWVIELLHLLGANMEQLHQRTLVLESNVRKWPLFRLYNIWLLFWIWGKQYALLCLVVLTVLNILRKHVYALVKRHLCP